MKKYPLMIPEMDEWANENMPRGPVEAKFQAPYIEAGEGLT
jgi:hypothetical protein